MSKCIVLLIFIDLAYSEHEGTEMLAVFTYANELGPQPGLNSPEINVVFDFLAGYNKTLEENLNDFMGGKQTAKKVIQQCQKWIFSQNCEIVKYFCNA